ncbi:hypothetical protein MHYP_G00171650 [Metynnis hypsauchen]
MGGYKNVIGCSFKLLMVLEIPYLGYLELDVLVLDKILSDDAPVRKRYHRLPPSQYEVVKTHTGELLDQGIVQVSCRSYTSPIVVVQKKDDTIRLCVDYRQLNSQTTKHVFPLPQIEESLDALARATLFSTLDMASGYNQVPMAEKDKAKTAFCTPFHRCHCPFELMFGQKPRLPVDALLGTLLEGQYGGPAEDSIKGHQEYLQSAYELASWHLQKAVAQRVWQQPEGNAELLPPGTVVYKRNHAPGRHKIQDVWDPKRRASRGVSSPNYWNNLQREWLKTRVQTLVWPQISGLMWDDYIKRSPAAAATCGGSDSGTADSRASAHLTPCYLDYTLSQKSRGKALP